MMQFQTVLVNFQLLPFERRFVHLDFHKGTGGGVIRFGPMFQTSSVLLVELFGMHYTSARSYIDVIIITIIIIN